jgi:hypothetical protein
LAAYVAFLLYGYRPAQFGDVRLPVSTILASFNMLAWYAFILAYRQATKGAARNGPLRLWDGALAFLALASLGAWGVAVTAVFNLSSPLLSAALTHLFLDLFAEGWFVLAVLGLAYAIPAIALWSERANLRISYLHWLLLGFVTLGLVAAAQVTWGREFVRGRKWLGTAVLLLILTLIPLTNVWPAAWHGRWTRELAAWAALGPVLVACGMVVWSVIRGPYSVSRKPYSVNRIP